MTDDQMEIEGDAEVVRQPVRATPPRAKQQAAKVVGKKKAAGGKRKTTPRPEAVVRSVSPVAEAPVRRNAARPVSRPEAARELARETTRPGAVVAMGHGGERLTRRRTGTGDKFEVPAAYIPHGWSYQWNPVTVLNQNIREIIVRGDLQMYENGWRPVPAARHPGHWTPPGYEGEIVIDGLRLEERPLSLTQEAQDEDTMRAKMQVRDRTDALRLTQKKLPGADVSLSRGQAGGMKMSIDPALDIPRPQHRLDTGE